MGESRHALIVVQNLPVPLDRRVWLECLALRSSGYDVSVICPKGPGDPARETLEGVEIYKYAPPPEAKSLPTYVFEFVYCWLRTALLTLAVWRRRPFQVLQACNPPDTYWLLARLWRSRGVRFVYDQHDLNPELFLSRFGEPSGLASTAQLRGLRWLERMTYRTADEVVSTNESYRSKALGRGGVAPEHATVVRSGPDTARMRPITPMVDSHSDQRVLAYLGIMGPQDGVDTVLQVLRLLRDGRGRKDVRAVLLGFGDCLQDLRAESLHLGLDDIVTFTGRVGPAEIARHLSSADIGLCPDPKTPLNDVSTMNKTMEYMAYCLPAVAFDLLETKVSGAETALYVPSGDLEGYADAIERLLDDDDLRVSMGLAARARVSEHLDWQEQARAYVGVFDRIFGVSPAGDVGEDRPGANPVVGQGADYIDLDDEQLLDDFVRYRGRARPQAAPTSPGRNLDQSGSSGPPKES